MTTTLRRLAMTFALLAVSLASGEARAAYINPVSVTGTGSFVGGASVITDGFLPPRGSAVTDPSIVSWNATSTFFTIDFGKVYTVANLIADVDNNDDYVVKYSTDGVTFKSLFTFLASDGPVTPAEGGSDILTTNPAFPSSVTYPGDSATPEYVGRGFAPVDARYLQISAANGDGVYGIGELDAFTAAAAVPEPSSLILTGLAALSGLGYWGARRRRMVVA